MNKINPRSIQDIGTLLRRQSIQFTQSVAHIHDTALRPKCRSDGNLRPVVKTNKKESKVCELTRKQESLTRDFSRALFLKTQFPFVNNNNDPDDFSSKELLDFEPVLNPIESNEVPLNSEIPDINYAEERHNRKEFSRSPGHLQSPMPQSTKLLSKFNGVKVNQSRSASTYEQNDAGSATGMPSLFSVQLHHVIPPPAEKRFVFRRQYSNMPCPVEKKEPVKPSDPIKPPDCPSFNEGVQLKEIPRFYYIKKAKNKPCFREICAKGSHPDTSGRKVCSRFFSSKSGSDKDKAKDDHCKNRRKTCPHVKPRGSCHENLADNPCVDKKPACDNKPTRQDCEVD